MPLDLFITFICPLYFLLSEQSDSGLIIFVLLTWLFGRLFIGCAAYFHSEAHHTYLASLGDAGIGGHYSNPLFHCGLQNNNI